MQILRYFSFAAEKEFACILAQNLQKNLPSDFMETKGKAMSVNRITTLLERNNQAAVEYQQNFKMSFIRRAVLANAFKWELKSKNYPSAFVDMATESLVIKLSKAEMVVRPKA